MGVLLSGGGVCGLEEVFRGDISLFEEARLLRALVYVFPLHLACMWSFAIDFLNFGFLSAAATPPSQEEPVEGCRDLV